MLKFCVEQWARNKGKLQENIEQNLVEYSNADYKDLVAKVTEFIFNGEEGIDEYAFEKYSTQKITQINDGDYQGTLLYLIPQKCYQPTEYEYLMTYAGYGSCSGCDTLKSIQPWWDNEEEITEHEKTQFVKDMMGLCLNLVQNTVKPYNTGWGRDEIFEAVE